MALYVKQENDKSELQKRIAAELRERTIRNSLDGDNPENPPRTEGFDPENSSYLAGTKQTTSLAFVWLLVFVAAVIAIGFFVWFAK